ncbi:GAF and ANTAR domain-containing protein [Kribbella sp. NPDC003505]|uniref:GAF and ANTAR domain-containing protein n=1 Tax=Kribbella sp. NPDC003505 TaxID=3154448 RepID=UPI00339EB448
MSTAALHQGHLAGHPRRQTDGAPQIRSRELTSADRFAQLALDLHDSGGIEETVEAVVEFALQALSCSHAGVALISGRPRRLEIPAVTDPLVAEIYKLQVDGGQGPLIESMRDHCVVRVEDAETDDRWPDWSAKVLELGVRSVLDVPLHTGNSVVGVLGLYSTQPGGFGPDEEAIAEILARHASVAVASARNEVNLAAAVDARKLVGQAMGILMERFDLDDERAFEVLRRYSQDNNRKLRDVAQELVDTRKLPR